MNGIISVSGDTFESVVLWSERPALVWFYSASCSSCHRVRPTLEELAAKYPGVLIACVNVGNRNNRSLVRRYRARGVPTVIGIREGVEISRAVGVYPMSQYEWMAQSMSVVSDITFLDDVEDGE